MRHIFLLLLLLLLSPLWGALGAFARGVSVSVSRPAYAGAPIEVTYTVDGRAREVTLTGAWGKGLRLLGGPAISQGSSYSVGTGGTSSSSSTSFTYVVEAARPGRYAVPGARIGKMSCNGTTVTVVKGQPAASPDPFDQMDQLQQQMQQRMQQYIDDIDQRSVRPGRQPDVDVPAARRTFLKASASKTSAYEQEAIYLTYKLYSVDEPTDLLRSLDPKFDNFQYKEIPPKGRRPIHIERLDGINYFAVTMYEYVLYPQRTGRLVIPRLTIDVQTRERVTAKADSVVMGIKPLPARPQGFCGAVGHDFKVEAALPTLSVATGDALTYTLRISGTGNLQLMSAPALDFPSSFETYDAKKSEHSEVTTEGNRGQVEFSYVVVPSEAGSFTIPPARFVYFDTPSGKYRTLTTKSFSVKVKKGKGRGHIDEQGTDIAPIHTRGDALRPAYSWTPVLIAYIVSLLLALIAGFALRLRFKARAPRAVRVATKRLRRAKALQEAGQREAFYDEVMRALLGYVSHRLGISNVELTRDNVEALMRQHGCDAEPVSRLLASIEACERARFAPGDPATTLRRTYDDAFQSIIQLDTQLP